MQNENVAKIGSDKPRRQAYEFAHRTVLSFARRDPPRFSAMALSGRLLPALNLLWERVGEQLPADQRIPGDGMQTSAHHRDHRLIVIVRPPSAEHISEAHFIGVVIEGQRVDRYFVLEHSWRLDDTPSTWMGEWTPDAHMSLGNGPRAGDEEGFLQDVISRLTGAV